MEGLQNNNSKPLWGYIKGKRNDNLGVSPLKEDGKIHSESKKKAEILLTLLGLMHQFAPILLYMIYSK